MPASRPLRGRAGQLKEGGTEMVQTYAPRRRAQEAAPRAATRDQLAGGQSMTALMAGAEAPAAQTLGRRVDLPQAIQEKMERAFGADLSGVEVYESQAVADAGAEAVTLGRRIGFAPGKLDMASSGGQALLGHELSHVVSQARGEASGRGFLRDQALEARADREGALAAAGEPVYTGPVSPLSSSGAEAAAGPMQARKANKKKDMLAPGFDPNKGVKKSGTKVDDDGLFFTSIFGDHEDRTKTEANPNNEILRYNGGRVNQARTAYRIAHQGSVEGFDPKGVDQAQVSEDVIGSEEEGQLKGHIYRPPGQGNGKQVILYSGSGGSNQDQMMGDVKQYLDAGYTVYAYDYGGFGKSTTKDGKLSEASMRTDAQRMYDHVMSKGGKASDTLLHGFSMGGVMASHVARNAAIQAEKSQAPEDKLGGLVMESSMRDVTNSAKAFSGAVMGGIGGAIGSRLHGDFDTMANLKELAALDQDLPVTFISGSREHKDAYGRDDPDDLAEAQTKLYQDSEGLFNHTQNFGVDSNHMDQNKLSGVWKQVKDKLMR